MEKYYTLVGVAHEPSTGRAEKLSNAAAGWIYHRALSHCLGHRTIGSILRNGLRRSYSERRRQQRRAGVHPDREHVAHCQRRGRSDTRQTIGNTQRPRRPGFSQQLYEYPRGRYSSVLLNYGENEELNSSPSQRTSTARPAATFAILMVILWRLGKARRTSLTADPPVDEE